MNTSTGNNHNDGITRQDVYARVTDRIVADLEQQGVRTWMKPWNAEHAAGKITRPLRHNGTPYSGINILMLWSAAMAGGFAAPIWMTFKQTPDGATHILVRITATSLQISGLMPPPRRRTTRLR